MITGIRIGRAAEIHLHPERNPAFRLLRRVLPLTNEYREDSLLVRENGRRRATPLLATLVLVATLDLVFAVDSIPAIFAVTRETFVVYAANAFSLLGLASLYFVLAGMMGRFRYLNLGLAVVLVFVGAKMALADFYETPVFVSLGIVVAALAAAVVASLVRPAERRPRSDESIEPETSPENDERHATSQVLIPGDAGIERMVRASR